MPARKCFAIPGSDSIIDLVHPETGRSEVYGKTLAEVREEDGAMVEILDLDDFCAAKAARQDSPVTWAEVSEEDYMDKLEVLPPAGQIGTAFLVGEPHDHHAVNGRARFVCYKREKGRHYRSSRPLTGVEFRETFGGRQ
jgi:hypothetical protein